MFCPDIVVGVSMLERKAYARLLEWQGHDRDTALLVTGARQIGKSYLVQRLGREKYDYIVEVNLFEDKKAKQALAQASDAQDLITRLSLFVSMPLVPGKTLIFIDEIQELPDIMTMVKFLVQDGRFAYAFSGSMLGTELKHIRSYPVGFVTEVNMFPMDFEEFCWANGTPAGALETVAECCRSARAVPEYLHERLLAYFRAYVVVGGMPAVVQSFVNEGGDLARVRHMQSDLVASYIGDITKYAGTLAPSIRAIFERLPLQLDAKSMRFKLNSLEPHARFEKFDLDFNWLVSAQVAWKCNVVKDPRSPLKATERPSSFKLYESDTGMLVSRYPMAVARALYLDDCELNLGYLFENVFAQALASCGFDLFYYMNRKRGEVDFLIEDAMGRVVPVEIKSGRSPRAHAALSALLANEAYGIENGYVLSRLNVERVGNVAYLPWYAAACLPEALGLEIDNEESESFKIVLPPV